MKNEIPFFIVNPHARGGKTGEFWLKIAPLVKEKFKNYEAVLTQGPGDATLQTRKAIEGGHRWLITVGGDGTINEVVNGCFHHGKIFDSKIELGFFPAGSGDDFVRTLKWPTQAQKALEKLKKKKTMTVDVGRASFHNASGKQDTRYFINIADFGLGAQVMKGVNASTKTFGSTLTYLYHSIASLISYRRASVMLELEGKTYHFPEVVIGIVANGKYFGNGLCVAPEADLTDGYFDVIIVERFWARDFLKMLPKLYRGQPIQGKNILRFKTQRITVQPESKEQVLIVTDGEQHGQLPATFELIPRCLRVCI